MKAEAGQGRVAEDARALIAIDLGAESCRVSLLRWVEARPVITLVHRFPNSPRVTPKGLQWSLAAIEAGVEWGLREAARIATEGVRSIAVDGWAVDYVHLDEEGKALDDPFCYRDERTVIAEARLHERISPERLRSLTGVQLSRINTLYQLFAESSDLLKRPWLNLPEYMLFRLGARPVAEHTNASHTQLLDLTARSWSKEIFDGAEIPLASAPELVPPGTVIGRLSGPLAELTAFADTTLIAPACHDTASAIAGIPAEGDDWAYISSGTWSLVGTMLDHPNNIGLSIGEDFTNLVATGGRSLFHKNVNGMWLIRQCLEDWKEKGREWSIEDLVAAAERTPAPDGLLEVDDPNLLLSGDMPARINAQRSSRGLSTIDDDPDNAPEFASLIFHSLAARYASVLRQLREHTGKALRNIYIVGGASQNLFLNRLTEEATGMKVIRGSQESSTLGNFAIQLATLESEFDEGFSSEVSVWAEKIHSAQQ